MGFVFQFSVALVVLTCCLAVSGKVIMDSSLSSHEWDHIVYTQSWPQSLCEHENTTGSNHECVIPSALKTWSVHGLWPSEGRSRSPSYCDDSYKFNEEEIKDIEPELDVQWANMFADTEEDSFWEHEWNKHGTCALNLPALHGEKKYFQMGLDLNKKFNIMSALEDASITPSGDKTYESSDIGDALQTAFGSKVCHSCKSAAGHQVLIQVEICLDKSLSVIDCPVCDDDCSHHNPIYYHPLHYNAGF